MATIVAGGFVPVHADGRPWEGALNVYSVPAADGTAIYLGDPVAQTSLGAGGLPGAARGAGIQFVGVMCGVAAPNLSATGTIYRAASALTNILVCDDPDACFMVQEDSVGGSLAAYSVGLNIDVSLGAGSTVHGRTNTLLDSSSAVSTATLDFKILRLAPIAGNVIGTGARWIVKPNRHARAHNVVGGQTA